MSRRRWGGFTNVAIAAVCVASPAVADEAPERPLAEAFTVSPAECLEQENLVPAVAQWLGRDAIDRRISIDVRREDDAVVYGLYQDDILVGRRAVTSLPAGCAALTTALALSIAVAIEATFFGVDKPAATPEAAPSPAPAPAPSDRPPARASARAKPGRVAPPARPQAALTGEVGILGNTLPGIRPLVSAGVDVAWSSHFETRVALVAAAPSTSPLGSGEVETRLYAGRADVCGATPTGLVKLRACLGLAWGFVESRGVGFLEGRSPSQAWLGLPLRGEGRIALGRDRANVAWGVAAATELIFTVRRAQLGVVGQNVDARTAVLTLPVLGGGATAGLFFEF